MSHEDINFLLFGLILVVMTGALLFGISYELSKGTLFEKLYLSRDIALMITTMHSGQGVGYYNYTPVKVNASKFIFALEKKKVSVSEENAEMPIFFPYAEDSNLGQIKTTNIRIKPDMNMPLSKSFIFGYNEVPYDTVPCTKSRKDFDQNLKILLDPASDHELTVNAMGSFKNMHDAEPIFNTNNVLITRPWFGGSRDNPAKVISKVQQADIIISMYVGDYEESENHIKAYINAKSRDFDSSYNLACFIGNELLRLAPDYSSTFSIIPVDPSIHKYGETINNDKIAVAIEIANKNNFLVVNHMKTKSLGIAIYKAIKDYYKK